MTAPARVVDTSAIVAVLFDEPGAAAIELGDTFAYALSVTTGLPLLWVGNDFTHTDVPRPG